MKLPSCGQAQVPREKITLYLLNRAHPEGRGKAIFFNRYGFTLERWQDLADALYEHGQTHAVVGIEETVFGTRYIVEGEIQTPSGFRPLVRVIWFVASKETIPRLATAYPLERRK